MTPWKKKLLAGTAIVVLVIMAAVGIWWSRRGQVTVQTGKVGRRDLAAIVTASGQIEPENYANVNANSIGKITDIYVEEGQRVKKGQLLMRTEDIQQQADVDAQQAALKTSEADLDAERAAVVSAAAAVRTARADLAQAKYQLAQAKLAYERGLELLKDSLIAKQDYDQRLSTFQVAQSTVQSSAAKLQQAQAQYRQTKFTADSDASTVAQNQAALVRAQNERDLTIYTSPYNGVVTALPVHVGENVVPGVQNQTGSLLFQVSDLSVMDAEVLVDETDIASVRLNQPAYVSIDALPNQEFKGVVTQIGQSAVSSTTGETTTASTQSTATSSQEAKQFKVVVRLKNPPAVLRPGLSATARVLTAEAKNTISIPIQALTLRSRKELEKQPKGGSGKVLAAEIQPPSPASPAFGFDPNHDEVQGVFVVRGGRAFFVPVKTGIMGAMNVQVLNGLRTGEEIVTGSYSALRTLANGAKIRINNTPPPVAGAGPSD